MGALTTPRLLSLSVALAALAAPGCDVPTTPETPTPVTPAPPVAPPPAQPPPPPAPTGTFQALPPEIARGGCSNLSWITTNATAVKIDQGVGPVSAGGSVVVCPTATATYVLTASGAGGTLDPPLTVTIVVTEPSPTPTPTPPSGGEETSDPEAHGPSGSLVAIPETIRRGESSVLAWAITSADRASIRPAVGLVEVVSSRAVSPSVTTTYTLSASGPGGDLSPEPHVTVTVLVPPSGSITANPREIAEGECASLSWSTGDATTQFVHPEVGDVPGSGSRTVCPTRTTTYRLNAAGRGGVLDPPPAVTILVRPSQTPAGSLVAFPDPIASGQCSTLTWTTSRSTSQSIDQGIGPVAASGSRSVCPAADTTYTLSASGPGGRLSPSPAVAITVGDPPPSGSLEADPPSIDAGGCSSLIWSITDATGIALDQGIGSVAASGSRSVCPAVTTAYTLTAAGRGGTLSPPLQATVSVAAVTAPTGSLAAEPPTIFRGECSRLRWSTTGAANRSIDQGIGAVGASGVRSVCPAVTTTYTLLASGPGGSLSPEPTVTIQVAVPTPTGGISADPLEIDSGQCSTLRWNTNDATSVSLDPGIGSVDATGSRQVCPSATTTYTLTATGSGGSLSPPPAVIVAVRRPAQEPMGSLTASVENIRPRECTTLVWTTTDAASQSISPGIGVVESAGSRQVCPSATTTYTLSASGPGGSLDPEPTVTIAVEEWGRPTGTFIASPPVIDRGECAMLGWTTSQATVVEIRPDIGRVAPSGSVEVCPTESVRYEFEAWNPDGYSFFLSAPITFTPPEPVLCQAVSISGTPMSGGEQPSACHAEIVDFRVETNKADSTIIDLYRGYPILGWSVQEVDDRYRHDVSVLWDPYDDRSRRFADSASMQPLIIHACPAGGTESVLACSGSQCDVYPDEASVPAVTLPTMRLQLSAPWGYSDIRELAEGETLDIPLSYEVGQDDLSTDYRVSVEFRFLHRQGPSSTRTVRRTPDRAKLQIRPGGPRTGTVSFQLSTDRDDVSQGDEDLLVQYVVSRVVGTGVSLSPGCTAQPNWIRIRLTDR